MHAISKRAERIFRKLIAGTGGGRISHRKIGKPGGAFMPLSVEHVGGGFAPIYSLAHYHTVNGDLCCDPDMTFLVCDRVIYPLEFQQAIPPVYQRAMELDGRGRPKSFKPKLQRSLARFANEWLVNIWHQQSEWFKENAGRSPKSAKTTSEHRGDTTPV